MIKGVTWKRKKRIKEWKKGQSLKLVNKRKGILKDGGGEERKERDYVLIPC